MNVKLCDGVAGLGYQEVKTRVPPTLDVACHNASDSSTLSGPTEDVLTYVKQLKDEGVFAKAVSAGNIAYHSRYIQPIAPKLLQYLQEVSHWPFSLSTLVIIFKTIMDFDLLSICLADGIIDKLVEIWKLKFTYYSEFNHSHIKEVYIYLVKYLVFVENPR